MPSAVEHFSLSAAALQPLAGTLTAGQKLGRYEVLAKLAAGGMAVVYVGRAQGVAGFERLVALKVLHENFAHEEEFIGMFLDEARLAARIRHPNVVPTIDISDSPDRGYFLVMEYIEGDHLGALLSAAHRAGERLPCPVVLRILSDVALGLGAAHDLRDESGKPLNIVHRDVSPHNVMVGRDGIARLTDFGVAKAEDRLTHTRDGQVKGKLAYMAPEQAKSGQSDSRSDLFSVGIILWECLTGRRLFRAENSGATLNKLLREPIAPPSSIDPSLEPLDEVVMRALERDPEQRFQSADELVEELERAARAVGGLASLRAVSKAVKHFAAPKIKRDKQLIEEAKRTLREQHGEEGFEIDGISEPSMASSSELSMSMASMSKISGVYSSSTATGLSAVAASAPPPSLAPRPPSLLPPPPAGALGAAAFLAPERRSLASRGAALRLALVLVTLIVVLSVWLGADRTEDVEVEPLSPLPAEALRPQPPAPSPLPAVQLQPPPAPTSEPSATVSPTAKSGSSQKKKPTRADTTRVGTTRAKAARPPVRERVRRAPRRAEQAPSESSEGSSRAREAAPSSHRPSKPTQPPMPDAPLANPYTD